MIGQDLPVVGVDPPFPHEEDDRRDGHGVTRHVICLVHDQELGRRRLDRNGHLRLIYYGKVMYVKLKLLYVIISSPFCSTAAYFGT